MMVASRETFPLLAELLAEQQRLDTPVARFASAFDTPGAFVGPQLIPLTRPNAGEHYAFEVDLDACTGCKSCVAACHSLNGLDDEETWRDVGMLVSDDARHPFTQTVTTACHHCADPACLNGCPVLAYEKDPVTGIVRHLDDQCIGCSYCILKCPYDVPKFSQRLGIVRKCDMCHDRLAAGEAPACAQACPTHAIRIVTVAASIDGAPLSAPDAAFLPAAPDPAYTQPTTRYVSRRPLPAGLAAGDATALRPQPAHWPLVVMLTLIPAAVGFSCLGATPAAPNYVRPAAAALSAAGLCASVFHLGQPLRAWRIFLGWRTSWLSREALLFGGWFALALAAVAVPGAAVAAAMVGVAGLFCSAMIYVDTRRQFWRPAETFPRFFGTGAVLALAVAAPLAGAAVLLAKLAWEARTYVRPPQRVTARLLSGPLRRVTGARFVFGAVAALILAAAGVDPASAPVGLGFVCAAVGELLERLVFFRAVDAPKMPGMPA